MRKPFFLHMQIPEDRFSHNEAQIMMALVLIDTVVVHKIP